MLPVRIQICFRSVRLFASLFALLVAILPMGQGGIAGAQAVTIGRVLSPVVGDGIQGYSGDGGPATSAELTAPNIITFDHAGNLYVAEPGNDLVRKVNTAGVITTVAGDGRFGFSGDGGPATNAELSNVSGIAVDSAGNLYIADDQNERVRKVSAATGIITTVVGNGTNAFSGDGGPATQAEIYAPEDLAFDSANNLYILDRANVRIRKVSATTGIITTVAGDGILGYTGDGGLAVDAEIAADSLIVDGAGNLYIGNWGFGLGLRPIRDISTVRKVTAATGIITTIAGTGIEGFSGDGGPATSAELDSPGEMAFDSLGNLYITDGDNRRIREVSAATGIITTVAGEGPSYPAGGCTTSEGTPTGSELCPNGVAVDSANNLYIVSGDAVYEVGPAPSPLMFPRVPVGTTSVATVIPLEINTDGTMITSISVPVSQGGKQEYTVTAIGCALSTPLAAGTECDVSISFSPAYVGGRPRPLQVQTSAGMFNFGMLGTGTGSEVELTPGTISTVVGNGSAGHSGDGGAALTAELHNPAGVAMDSGGNIFVVDGAAIRKVTASTGLITTVAGNGTAGYSGDGGPAVNAEIQPSDITVDSAGNLYIGDTSNNAIRKVAANTGIITTVAGNGTEGFSGDGGLATNAEIGLPGNVAFDRVGNFYFPDKANNRVREVQTTTGIITTVAGNGTAGYSGDGGLPTSAELNSPSNIAFDSQNNLYISDSGNNAVRKVTVNTGFISTVAGTGTPGHSGDGGPATGAELHSPGPIVFDSADNLYISDGNNNLIREVTAKTGTIITVAGNGTQGYSGDGGSATAAELDQPFGIALDGTGNLYIADSSNNRIREVNVLESTLNYASTLVGATSVDSPQTAVVTNIGNDQLELLGLISSPNPLISSTSFLLEDNSTCPEIKPTADPVYFGPGEFCTLNISFEPKSLGVNTGTATITDNALNTAVSTQVVHLNEVGPTTGTVGDFTLTVTPSNRAVSPGSTATYTISVSGTGGFSGTVALAASGLPAGATMTLSPTSVTVSGGGSSTATLTIVTAGAHAQLRAGGRPLHGKGSPVRYGLLLLPLPLLGIIRLRKKVGALPRVGMLLILCVLSLGSVIAGMTGCADQGFDLEPQSSTITVTGTSDTLQHSANVGLTVEYFIPIK